MSPTPIRTRAEVEAYITAKIDTWEAASDKRLTHDLELIARRQVPALLSADLGSVLVSLLGPETVKAALLRHINEVTFAPEAP